MDKNSFSSGLRDEYELTIYMPYFGYDDKYQDGEVLLMILDGVDEDEEPVHEIFSVGQGWETQDGGKTMLTPNKPNKRVNKQTNYGIWCNWALEAVSAAGSNYLDDKDPNVADTWLNTKWKMTEQQVAESWFNKRDQKEVAARFRLVPTEFLGIATDEPTTSTPAPATDALAERKAALKAQTDGRVPTPSTNGHSPTVLKLIDLAKTLPMSDFLSAALDIDEVVLDESLAASVVDTSDSGFYALNHG